MPAPQSPSVDGPESINEAVNEYINGLSKAHGLMLRPRGPQESPSRHRAAHGDAKSFECTSWIVFLWFKSKGDLQEARLAFEEIAVTIKHGWRNKPRADRSIPAVASLRVAETTVERGQLIDALHARLQPRVEIVKAKTRRQPLTKALSVGSRPLSHETIIPPTTPSKSATVRSPGLHTSDSKMRQSKINFAPLPIDPRLGRTPKRPSEDFEDSNSIFKKPYVPNSIKPLRFEALPVNMDGSQALPAKKYRVDDHQALLRGSSVSTRSRNEKDSVNQPDLLSAPYSINFRANPGHGRGKPSFLSDISAGTSFESNVSTVFDQNTCDIAFEAQSSVETSDLNIVSAGKSSYQQFSKQVSGTLLSSSYDDLGAEDAMNHLLTNDCDTVMQDTAGRQNISAQDKPDPEIMSHEENALQDSMEARLLNVFRKFHNQMR